MVAAFHQLLTLAVYRNFFLFLQEARYLEYFRDNNCYMQYH